MDIAGKTVTVIGAGLSGKSLANLIHQLNGSVKVSDKGFCEDFDDWARDNKIQYEHDGHTRRFIEESDLVVLSPGVSINSEIVHWAQQKKIPVLGEIEFSAQFCIQPIIAVTGSNGKTTVATLIHEILCESGLKSQICGNIGVPFASCCLKKEVDHFVLEVSSFQLESILNDQSACHKIEKNGKWKIKGFKPFIAVFLNFSENHLDRHRDLDEYFGTKAKLFINQQEEDFAVLSEKNQRIHQLGDQISSKVSFYDSVGKMEQFNTRNPNQLAVLDVARILNISPEVCFNVFKQFKGVEHRLEWVRNFSGIDFINDSKATTAEASRWALSSFDQPVVLICGGRDKNIDFSVLKDIVHQKVKRLIVFGEAKEKLEKTFEDVVDVDGCDLLEDAVLMAKRYARQGDCVVLSPMCSSFDMFANFEQRGQVFKEIVNRIEK